jgi:hypothetical protein
MVAIEKKQMQNIILENYINSYDVKQIELFERELSQLLYSFHLSKANAKQFWKKMLQMAQRGTPLAEILREANTQIRDIKANQEGWLPIQKWIRLCYTNDELAVIAKGKKDITHRKIFGMLNQAYLRKQFTKNNNWHFDQHLRQALQLLTKTIDGNHDTNGNTKNKQYIEFAIQKQKQFFDYKPKPDHSIHANNKEDFDRLVKLQY